LAVIALAFLRRESSALNDWYVQMMTGQSITVGKGDKIIYSGTATHEDAEKLGQTLGQIGFFTKPGVAMLLSKNSGAIYLSMPMKEDKTRPPWDDPQILASFTAIGPVIATTVGGPPLSIRLLDDKGELKKEIKIDKGAVLVGVRDRVTYSGQATQKDAISLGKALQAYGFFKNRGAQVSLVKGQGGSEVSFYFNKVTPDDPKSVAYLQTLGHQIAPAVGGPPLKIHAIDSNGEIREDLSIQ
jgi:hypothetical protein